MKIKIEGMTCDGCARSVAKALQRVDPGAGLKVDLRSGEVDVTGLITAEQARVAVEKAGFRFVSAL